MKPGRRRRDIDSSAPKSKKPSRLPRADLYVLLIVSAVVLLAYANSLTCPFMYDDGPSIETNTSVHSLWPIWDTFRPSPESTMGGRPLANFSFALNYAVSGLHVWSYRVTNLAIHICAALVLFGILRHTFVWCDSQALPRRRCHTIALACTLIWAVHPLQTQSVTYIKQRCESLMGLMLLLTLYCAIRGWKSRTPGRWHLAAAGACLVGAGMKPVIAVVPFLVFVYDILFVHKTPLQALRRSPWLYAGQAACLLVLCGFVIPGIQWEQGPAWTYTTPMQYARTECAVLWHYLRLAVWPHPLVLDYWWRVASVKDALPYAVGVLVLGGVSAYGLLKRRAWSFAAVWFFVILAPTSSIMPLPEPAVEHRMYLPLASLIVLAVLGAHAGFDRLAQRRGARAQHASAVPITLVIAVIMLFSVMTFMRNRDYSSALVMWRDNVEKRPRNPRAHYNYATNLARRGSAPAALPHFQETVRLDPNYPDGHFNLGLALARLGRPEDAVVAFKEALRVKPTDEGARECLETLTQDLSSTGRNAETGRPRRRD